MQLPIVEIYIFKHYFTINVIPYNYVTPLPWEPRPFSRETGSERKDEGKSSRNGRVL